VWEKWQRSRNKEIEITAGGKNRIMIYGPKNDGTHLIEFRTARARRWRSRFPRTEAARVMEEAKKVLQETRLPASVKHDRKGRLDLSRMSNETLARDLYISTQMQLRFPQLPSSAYRAALEEEIRRRGYSIESMLRTADAATTWDKDEAWDMVRAALERQYPKSSS
jgi:hypothetical protein